MKKFKTLGIVSIVIIAAIFAIILTHGKKDSEAAKFQGLYQFSLGDQMIHWSIEMKNNTQKTISALDLNLKTYDDLGKVTKDANFKIDSDTQFREDGSNVMPEYYPKGKIAIPPGAVFYYTNVIFPNENKIYKFVEFTPSGLKNLADLSGRKDLKLIDCISKTKREIVVNGVAYSE